MEAMIPTEKEFLALLKKGPVRARELADPRTGDLMKVARKLHGYWVKQTEPVHRHWEASEYVYRRPGTS